MNLKEWAASQGVSYATARRWYEAGRLPVPAYRVGRLIVICDPRPSMDSEAARLRRLLAECILAGSLPEGLAVRVRAELGQ